MTKSLLLFYSIFTKNNSTCKLFKIDNSKLNKIDLQQDTYLQYHTFLNIQKVIFLQ